MLDCSASRCELRRIPDPLDEQPPLVAPHPFETLAITVAACLIKGSLHSGSDR